MNKQSKPFEASQQDKKDKFLKFQASVRRKMRYRREMYVLKTET